MQHGNREIDKCDKRKMEVSQIVEVREMKEVCVCVCVCVCVREREFRWLPHLRGNIPMIGSADSDNTATTHKIIHHAC